MEKKETTGTVRLLDTETGQVIASGTYYPNSERDAKELKGWIFRYRTAHKRHTGHSLRVEKTLG